VADMNADAASVPMPTPTRLTTPTRFFRGDYRFTPVSATFEPRSSAREAWREDHDPKQASATYRIVLAVIHPDNPSGTHAPFDSQAVWVVLARHVAFVPEKFPGSPTPTCIFGASVSVSSAQSGKSLVGVAQ
jgi:hypothetical protein